jgi:hypothetical protein
VARIIGTPASRNPAIRAVEYCLAVVFLALQVQRTSTGTVHGDRRLHRYALQLIIMLLIPLAVALAAFVQRRRGGFHHG